MQFPDLSWFGRQTLLVVGLAAVMYGIYSFAVERGWKLGFRTRRPLPAANSQQVAHTDHLRVGTVSIYVGGDPWNNQFVPMVHTHMDIRSIAPTQIQDLRARLESNGWAQEFRIWTTRDWGASKDPPPMRTSAFPVTGELRHLWSYFQLADETWKTFRFQPGDYSLSLLATDDAGKPFVLKGGMRITLTPDHVKHIKAKEGVYFNWDGEAQKYAPVLSAHLPSSRKKE